MTPNTTERFEKFTEAFRFLCLSYDVALIPLDGLIVVIDQRRAADGAEFGCMDGTQEDFDSQDH